MTYTVRNDIPLPPLRDRRKWPFATMVVDDSLPIEFDRDWLAACRAAQATGKRKGWRFVCKWYKSGNATVATPHGVIWRAAVILLLLLAAPAHADEYDRAEYHAGESHAYSSYQPDTFPTTDYRQGIADANAAQDNLQTQLLAMQQARIDRQRQEPELPKPTDKLH